MLSFTMLVSVGLAACVSDVPTIERWPLQEGGSIADLAKGKEAKVVLLIDPAQCLTCLGTLGTWVQWGRTHGAEFEVVLTKEPGRYDAMPALASLRGQRVWHLGLSDRTYKLYTPAEYVVRGGRIVYADSLLAEQFSSPLLQALTADPSRRLSDIPLEQLADTFPQPTQVPY